MGEANYMDLEEKFFFVVFLSHSLWVVITEYKLMFLYCAL